MVHLFKNFTQDSVVVEYFRTQPTPKISPNHVTNFFMGFYCFYKIFQDFLNISERSCKIPEKSGGRGGGLLQRKAFGSITPEILQGEWQKNEIFNFFLAFPGSDIASCYFRVVTNNLMLMFLFSRFFFTKVVNSKSRISNFSFQKCLEQSQGGFHKGTEQLICSLFVIFGQLSYSQIGSK